VSAPSYELSDYDFELPSAQIAQRPVEPRDASRLLAIERGRGAPTHHHTRDLADLLPRGALLVVNDTKVMPARLNARKPTGGKVELLLTRPGPDTDPAAQPVIYRTAKKLRAGTELALSTGGHATVIEVLEGGRAIVDLRGGLPGRAGEDATGIPELLSAAGNVPLPPYIRGGQESPDGADRDRYQCVYARAPGAVAAPTAGLHFTPNLLQALENNGIARCAVTLHVGPGTFLPVRVDDLRAHSVLPERFELSARTAASLATARAEGRPIIAVGTTTTRVLETVMHRHGAFVPCAGDADLTILPGHDFKAIDGLLTNFHLPRTSLLVLVATLAGREHLLTAYREAVREGYRFYSYGDAMLIRPT